jgi:hypothetical protein
MKLLILALCAVTLNSFASSGSPSLSESECRTIGEDTFFEMSTGFIGCNTTAVMSSLDSSKLVNGKCQFKVTLEEMQTEMGCGNGPQIRFEPGHIIAVRKFNRICKKIGYKRIKKERNDYGQRMITCLQK